MILSVRTHERTLIHAMVDLSKAELLAAISGGKLDEYAADVAKALLPCRKEGAEQFDISFVEHVVDESEPFDVLVDVLKKLRLAIECAEDEIMGSPAD